MSTFYEKYKKIRLDQKIDLTDIENRTKISIKYLEAIENGNFEVIQKPYLRLFLKAYINEIGAEPEDALSELSEHLLKNDGIKPTQKPIIQTREIIKEEPKEEKPKDGKAEEHKVETPKIKDISKDLKTSKSMVSGISPNLIKGILFIAAWVVALFIIRNITLESDSENNQAPQSPIIETISNYVDFAQLQVDYAEVSSQQNVLEASPPYIVKIVTNNMLGIVAQQDSLDIESIPIAGGSQHTFTYEKRLDLVLNHSDGISAFINGESISDIREQDSPTRLIFSLNPNSISIIHYELTD